MGYFGAPFYVLSFLGESNMLPLSSPTFSGLPTDPVKKVDVYTEVSPSLANSLVSKVSAFDTSLESIIGGATKMVAGIGVAMKDRGMSVNDAKSRVSQALGGSRSAISDIASILERAITGDLTGVDEGTGYVRGANTMIDSVKLVYDGVDRTFLSSDYKSVSSVMGFISDLAGNSLINVFDLGAQAALVKGIIMEISDWGIPELIDETFGAKWNEDTKSYKYTYDDQFRFSVTKRASEDLSPTTSLDVIERLMLHGGDAALIAENPGFPEKLLQGYVLPEGCVAGGLYPVMVPDPANPSGPQIPDPTGAQTVGNYVDQGQRLIRILNVLKPEWFYATRDVFTGTEWRKDTVWNLQYLTGASDDARTVLMTNPDLRAGILSAPFYRVDSGITMLKTMYPFFVAA
jgi:hypothetical protein